MNNNAEILSTVRIRPAVWPGVLVYVVYLLVFYAAFILVGIDYGHIGKNADTLLAWLLPPTLAGLVVAVLSPSILGWWRPALSEQRQLPRWAICVPILVAAVAVGNMVFGDYSTVTPLMWACLIGGCLMVGFNEEMIHRGMLVVALRSRYGEIMVWFLSSTMFALFHLPNIFFGIGALAIVQVVIAFGMGSAFYLARRTSGSLIPAMLLHGLWDLSAFSAHVPYSGMLAPLLALMAVIVAAIALVRERRMHDTVYSGMCK